MSLVICKFLLLHKYTCEHIFLLFLFTRFQILVVLNITWCIMIKCNLCHPSLNLCNLFNDFFYLGTTLITTKTTRFQINRPIIFEFFFAGFSAYNFFNSSFHKILSSRCKFTLFGITEPLAIHLSSIINLWFCNRLFKMVYINKLAYAL